MILCAALMFSLAVSPAHAQSGVGIPILGVWPTGIMPKQVVFSPDGNFIYVPLLEGKGFQVIEAKKKGATQTVKVPGFGPWKGFVEGLFIAEKKRFLISQMNTGLLFEYDVSDPWNPAYVRGIETHGCWPKVIAHSPAKGWLAVSNWLTSSVAIIDYGSGKIVRLIENLDTPRGLAFSASGDSLLVASFEGGFVSKFDTTTWRESGRFSVQGSAMRHVLLTADGSLCWVSDMMFSRVYKIGMADFALVSTVDVYTNPNTIGLALGGRILFVSCRGRNDPVDYTRPSPENGKIAVIDTGTMKVIRYIEGGNQPTGLAVSPDGRLLCFSNFQDNNVELLDITSILP